MSLRQSSRNASQISASEVNGDAPPPPTPSRIQWRSKRSKQNSLELLTLSMSKVDLKEGLDLHEDTNLVPSKKSSLFHTTTLSTPLRENPSTKQKNTNMPAIHSTIESIKVTSVNLVRKYDAND